MLMVKNRRMHSHQNSENVTNESTSSTNTVPVVVSVSTTAGNTITNNIPPHVRNKEHSLASHIPGYVTKLEDTKAGGRYLCTPCQSHCNSDIQLSQHLSSRKHMEKLSRKMNSTNGVMGGERCHVVDISNRPIHQGNIFCHVCKLSFSSQSVMDTHMTGSKHQRKLKSLELIKSLEGTEPGFKYDTLTGDIICTLCDVIFYSPQHIKRHIEGEKHKGKRENGEEGGTPAKKHCAANLGHSVNDNEHSGAGFEASEGNAITTITSSSMTSTAPPRKDQALLNMNIPSCVSKVEDPQTGGKFLCNPCQAYCNSDIQLSQHMSSKKHLDKVSGKRRLPTRGAGQGIGQGWKGDNTSGRAHGSSASHCGYENSGQTSCSAAQYAQSVYPSSSVSSNRDSYGLSSLGRGATTSDYSSGSYGGRFSGRTRGGSYSHSLAYSRTDYVRSEPYNQTEVNYGRGTSYGQATMEPYSQADYSSVDYRPEDLAAYCRQPPPSADNIHQNYGTSQNLGGQVGGRAFSFAYTHPITPSFMSGGSIL